MNRTKKRWAARAATTVLAVSLMAGCSQGANSNASGNGTGNAGSNNGESSAPAAFNPTGMPIVNEPLELTFFTGKAATNGSNFEETLVWSEYAKQSGIDVNFNLVPFESLTERRNLALANGDYPDGFYSARVPAADLMRYGAQGVFLPLNDLIEKHAPNFSKLMEEYPDLRRALTMPDGNIYSFPTFYRPDFLPMLIGTPLWVKQDWLDQLGMEEPVTTDELYEYLKAVKATDLNGNGQADEIPYSGTGIYPFIEQIMGAWGLGNRGLGHKYVDADPDSGGLRFYRTDDRFREVLEYVNKLYAEGLIDKDIFTQDGSQLYAKGGEERLGATINPNPKTQFNGENYVGLGALQGPHGDQLYSHIKLPMVWPGAFVITDKNEHPEATIRWIDHFYGDEGATFYFMGLEGVSYNVAEDGTLEFIDEITSNPDGLSMDQALTKYVTWLGGSYPGYVQEKYFKGSETLPEAVATGEKAAPHALEEQWYSFNYTEEETEFLSSVGSDLQTFITETEAQFINGSKSFSEWDAYVQQVESMGLDEYMRIHQAAYDRYSAQ
ncbi:extracellular solute-binding protein [Paenibacillus sp. 1P07SE]|uniref:extracellular solute-binding protein n=1 Tax=Paenibacillus sp. 1P07SE TaxID=3132209 RepID=UPI0039A46C35